METQPTDMTPGPCVGPMGERAVYCGLRDSTHNGITLNLHSYVCEGEPYLSFSRIAPRPVQPGQVFTAPMGGHADHLVTPADLEAMAVRIASANFSSVYTLSTTSTEDDYHEVHVSCIRAALIDAFQAGMDAALSGGR